ncbi:MAG: hypothetical protein QNJ44_10715 [Rhodobacter sp.]|nr:hypothetical protein [Rhodobacter sp.]
MLGFESDTPAGEAAANGVIQIPLKFDMPAADWAKIKRADLVFEDVGHIGESFEVRAFFNNKKANGETKRTAANGYAGRFVVFGHGNCFGAAGHCNATSSVSRGFPVSSATQLAHPARPHRRILTVTEALNRVLKRYRKGLHTLTLVVTSKSPRRADRRPAAELFKCRRISIQAYS